jgi:hypothetical protein
LFNERQITCPYLQGAVKLMGQVAELSVIRTTCNEPLQLVRQCPHFFIHDEVEAQPVKRERDPYLSLRAPSQSSHADLRLAA